MSLYDRVVLTEAAQKRLSSEMVRGKEIKAVRKPGNMVLFSGSPTGKHSVLDDPAGRWKTHWSGYLEMAKTRLMSKVPRLTFGKAVSVIERIDKAENAEEDPVLAKAAVVQVLKGGHVGEQALDKWITNAKDVWSAAAEDLSDIQDQGGGSRRQNRLLRDITKLVQSAEPRQLNLVVRATGGWLRS